VAPRGGKNPWKKTVDSASLEPWEEKKKSVRECQGTSKRKKRGKLKFGGGGKKQTGTDELRGAKNSPPKKRQPGKGKLCGGAKKTHTGMSPSGL